MPLPKVGERLKEGEITCLKNLMVSFHVSPYIEEALCCLIGVTSCILAVYETNPPQCIFSAELYYENRHYCCAPSLHTEVSPQW